MRLSVKVQGLEDLERKLASVPEELNRQERALLHQAVIMVRDEARSRINSPLGRAARGIQSDVQDLPGNRIFGRIRSRNVAAVFSQKGRTPGRPPSTRKIRRWLMRMGDSPTAQQVFLIARAIGSRGTKGRPVMQDAYEFRSQQVVQLFKDALETAVRKVAGR